MIEKVQMGREPGDAALVIVQQEGEALVQLICEPCQARQRVLGAHQEVVVQPPVWPVDGCIQPVS